MSNSEKYWVSDYQDILHERQKELNEYLQSLKLENKAEATIIKYRRVLERFLMECSISLEELSSDDIRIWLTHFSRGKKYRVTVTHTISTLFRQLIRVGTGLVKKQSTIFLDGWLF